MSVVPQGYRRVGENRIRENVGFGLGDLVVGQVIEHRPARTVTETDHVLTLALTGNPAPVHSDTQFCERTGRWSAGSSRWASCWAPLSAPPAA